ncbi:MAG: GNAT family N-acetyltransferase [Lachnospiraceae bacterium]|nr:GNAT family N-acetyltransferase [Lachnospiraceae bacterium]
MEIKTERLLIRKVVADDWVSLKRIWDDFRVSEYAKECYQALINLFSDKGIKRLTAGTALKNIPSVRLLNSLGFKQIGTEKVSFYQDEDGNDIYFDGGIFELKME